MKKTTIVIISLLLFYLNLFLLKSMFINFILAIILVSFPFFCIPTILKEKNKDKKKNVIFALIIWGVAAIPTGMMIVMTIIFGLPPEGYGPMDMFG